MSNAWRLLALPLIASTLSCHGIRYGLSNMMRPAPDYERLDRERAEDSLSLDGAREEQPAYWTQYRGVEGDGIDRRSSFAWSGGDAPREVWRKAIGPAYSSFVIAAGLAITMEQRREEEYLLAFDLRDGSLVWEYGWEARFYDSMGKEGPRSTPAVEGDAVVAVGGTGQVVCLDLRSGQLRWRKDVLGEDDNLAYGLSASPRIEDGRVFVQGAKGLFAYRLQDGALDWRALPVKMAYATPQIADILGQRTLIAATAKRVVGLDPATGSEAWSFPWEVSNDLTCTMPVVVGDDRVFVSAGYGKGSQLFRLSRPQGPQIEAELVWRTSRFKSRFNEPVLMEGFVVGLDSGRLAALDLETGKMLWKDKRYGFGQVIASQGRLLLLDAEGNVHLLEVDSEGPRSLGEFPALDGEVALAIPAVAHGQLYLRNEREVAVFAGQPAP